MREKPDSVGWLYGRNGRCNAPTQQSSRPLRFVLLGAPGVGKGAQARLLAEFFGSCHLSTHDIFQAAKISPIDCRRSPVMAEAASFMDAGQLVPDEAVLLLVAEQERRPHSRGGFILDGFPRTVAQAEVLERLLGKLHVELDAVLNYELPIEKLVARLSGRRMCPICKRIFHDETRPPKQPRLCDDCGAELFQRKDDRAEAIRARVQAYERSIAPLAAFYRDRDLFVSISAEETPEEVFARTLEALNFRSEPMPV